MQCSSGCPGQYQCGEFDILQAVKCQGIDLDSLLPDQEMLMKIMVHPLQIQVLYWMGYSALAYVCVFFFIIRFTLH